MKRIIVIGCPGSGKTTFSIKLCERIGLPLFHLDTLWHKPDKTHISREEFDLRLGQLLSRECWIIDGNYSRTLERRIRACDTVILYDLPTELCLAGAVSRLGKPRQDMPWIDTQLDPKLKEQIENFKAEDLPRIYGLLDKYSDGRNIFIFKSREQAQDFIQGI